MSPVQAYRQSSGTSRVTVGGWSEVGSAVLVDDHSATSANDVLGLDDRRQPLSSRNLTETSRHEKCTGGIWIGSPDRLPRAPAATPSADPR